MMSDKSASFRGGYLLVIDIYLQFIMAAFRSNSAAKTATRPRDAIQAHTAFASTRNNGVSVLS